MPQEWPYFVFDRELSYAQADWDWADYADESAVDDYSGESNDGGGSSEEGNAGDDGSEIGSDTVDSADIPYVSTSTVTVSAWLPPQQV